MYMAIHTAIHSNFDHQCIIDYLWLGGIILKLRSVAMVDYQCAQSEIRPEMEVNS